MLKLQGLAAELLEQIRQIPVVDCHEHLPTEAARLTVPMDAMRLFSHYCRADLLGAGLDEPALEEIYDGDKPVGQRWNMFKDAFEAIRYGSYAYPAMAYIRDVLGFDDLNDQTVEAISAKLRADQKPGYYRRIMRDLCGIETAIQCTGGVIAGDQDFFVYLCGDKAVGLVIDELERLTDRHIHTLGHYVDALGQYISDQKQLGAVGYKIGAAYQRTLDFPAVSAGDADQVFVKLRAKVASSVSDVERELLESYLVRRAVEACIEVDMPVVIHTGYQAGVHNDIRNARATHLWSLIRDYGEARFDLFHGSFPYVEDMTVLGKYFENVSLNMCWMHIMGPAVARRALSQWLDAVPVTRIFAFGGDYSVVEKIYGHLELARADVAEVLAAKVTRGRFTADEAVSIARLLFHDNAKRWYALP